MAVLVEAISVVIKASSIAGRFPGGLENFAQHIPNRTLCADGEVVRVGFMDPADVKVYIEKLASVGLRHLTDAGSADDLVVVDQMRGLTSPCEWAEIGVIPWQGDATRRVLACRMKGSALTKVSVPESWVYSQSYTSKLSFKSPGEAPPGTPPVSK